jgi:hypothetical protein
MPNGRAKRILPINERCFITLYFIIRFFVLNMRIIQM